MNRGRRAPKRAESKLGPQSGGLQLDGGASGGAQSEGGWEGELRCLDFEVRPSCLHGLPTAPGGELLLTGPKGNEGTSPAPSEGVPGSRRRVGRDKVLEAGAELLAGKAGFAVGEVLTKVEKPVRDKGGCLTPAYCGEALGGSDGELVVKEVI